MYKDDLKISQMSDEDIPFVYLIEKDTFSDLWSEGTYKNFREEQGRSYYVAKTAGKVAAYCVIMQVLDECEILKIAVSREERQKGIGEKLLTKVMEEAGDNNARFFYLEVRESNIPAINLYKKLGFIESGRRPDYYRKPAEAAVLMSRVI